MFTYNIEGQLSYLNFVYCTFGPNKYISVFGRVQISCGRLPTRFLFKFPYTIIVKKGKISNSFIGKTTCVIGKAIKNYI